MSKIIWILALLFCFQASIYAVDWIGGYGDNEWDLWLNWNPDVPTALDDTTIKLDDPGHTPVFIGPGVEAACKRLRVGSDAGKYGNILMTGGILRVNSHLELGDYGTGVFDLEGGEVFITHEFQIGDEPTGQGTFNISGNAVINAGTSRFINVGNKGYGVMNMTGGTINIPSYDLQVGDAGGTGVVEMSGGTINIARNLKVGGGAAGGNGQFTMTGGVINAKSLYVPEATGAFGLLEVFGGTINVTTGYLTMKDGGYIDIKDGQLVMADSDGSAKSNVEGKVAAGMIYGFGGYGSVDAVWNGSDTTTVTATAPDEAYNLAPVGEVYEPSDPNGLELTWEYGGQATEHHLYFSADEAGVTARTAGYQGSVTSPHFIAPENYTAGNTYYWVVDESDGVTTWPGTVVSVKIVAQTPYPENLEPQGLDVDINTDLSWADGSQATEHYVYISADEQLVIDMDASVMMGPAVSPYNIDTLANNTTYFWRVVATDGVTDWASEVVSFRTAPAASASWDPQDPGDLSWTTLANWTGGAGAGVSSTVDDPDYPVYISAGMTTPEVAGTGGTLLIGSTAGSSGSVVVDGGELSVKSLLDIGVYGTGSLTVNSGTVGGTATINIAHSGTGASGFLTINGGDVNSADHFWIGRVGAGFVEVNDGTLSVAAGKDLIMANGLDSSLTINGGLVEVPNNCRIGYKHHGSLIVTGGTLKTKSLLVPYSDSFPGSGNVTITGGTIEGLVQLKNNGTMNIDGGTIISAGDQVGRYTETYASKISAYGGFGTLSAVYDSETDTTTLTAIAPDGTVIDPFDQYADTAALTAEWSGTATAEIDDTDAIVGSRAMTMAYSGTSSSLSRSITADISSLSIEARLLTLYVRGDSGNDEAELSVTLDSPAGSAAVAYTGMISEEGWQRWLIPLADFAGVDLNDITGITITVGDGVTSASGTIGIDQIQFAEAQCIADYTIADVNNDCVVNFDDYFAVAYDWMLSGYDVSPEAVGGDLVLHYPLDDTGVTVADQAGSYDGATTADNWQSTGGFDGGAYLSFDGSNFVTIPVAVIDNIANTGELSISMWVRGDAASDGVRQMLFSSRTPADEGHILNFDIQYYSEEEFSLVFESGHDTDRQEDWEWFYWGWNSSGMDIPRDDTVFYDGWNHVVCTKNLSTGVQRLYFNGVVVGENRSATTAIPPSSDIGFFILGGFAPGSIMYQGDLDDFKIYNRELSHGEILTLSGYTDPTYHQDILSDVDFDESDDIGTGDLQIMADVWLQDQRWPAAL
jgi:T5SS/PEP-CTERM-associated repeat protein